MTGNPSETATATSAMERGKEAARKAPAGRTEITYEAPMKWARGQLDSNPMVIRTDLVYMWPVDGAKVTCLTLGRLYFCLGRRRREATYRNTVGSRGRSTHGRIREEGPNTRNNRCPTLDERWRGRIWPEMVSSSGEDSGGTVNISKERLKLSRRRRRDTGEKRWNNYYYLRTNWKTGEALL